jgi:hypothetical protein
MSSRPRSRSVRMSNAKTPRAENLDEGISLKILMLAVRVR